MSKVWLYFNDYLFLEKQYKLCSDHLLDGTLLSLEIALVFLPG